MDVELEKNNAASHSDVGFQHEIQNGKTFHYEPYTFYRKRKLDESHDSIESENNKKRYFLRYISKRYRTTGNCRSQTN